MPRTRPKRAEPQAQLLTVNQAAQMLSAHPGTVRRWIREGRLAHVRLPGGGLRISTDTIETVVSGARAG